MHLNHKNWRGFKTYFYLPLKKASIYLYSCSYVLKHLNLGLGDLWRDQLNCEPRTLPVTSKRYNYFHGNNVFWHYEVNSVLLDTKWYQEKIIYLLQVRHPQRIKHSLRGENCFFLIIMECPPDTVFFLPWSIRELAIMIHFYALLSFQCIAKERTQCQNEECHFHWKSKATIQWSNSQICIPKTQIVSTLKIKVHFQKRNRTVGYKHVQPGWFTAT